MNKLTDRPPMSQTDKLCLVALAGVILTAALADWAMDAAAIWAAEADKPQVEVVEVEIVPPIDCTPLVEAIAARRAELENELFWQTVPLDAECRAARNHLSQEQALDWLARNAGPNSQYVFLHQHMEKEKKDG